MGTALKNRWTTIIGVLLGIVTYLSLAGPTMPSTKQEWISLLVGALLAGLGIAAKDASTGSAPK